MSGINLLDPQRLTPQGIDLLGGRNLLEDESPSVLETLISLPERAWKGLVSGATTTHAAYADRQATIAPEQLETYQRFPDSPAAKEYFKQRKEADQAIQTHELMKKELAAARPLGAHNSMFDRVVGGTVESAGSLIPTIALGAINPGLGMAAGLATNFAMEAGGQWDEARSKGATDEQISRSMGFGGAVSTILELPVLNFARKLMAGEVKKGFGRSMGELAAREWGQEQLTQHAMDLEANVSGWGNYSKGEILERGLIAGASGALLGSGLGAASHVIGSAKERNAEIIQTKALTDVIAQTAGITDPVEKDEIAGRVMESIRSLKIDPELAEMQREAMMGKFKDVPNTVFGSELGRRMDEASWSKVGKEPDQDVGGITPKVEERRNTYLEEGRQDTTPHAERIILAQTNPAAVGLKLGQIENLPDGSVTVISGSAYSQESLFPGVLPEALQRTVQSLTRKLGITAPVVITMEQLADNEMGRYSRLGLPDGRYTHIINPRELPSWRYGGNQTTLVEFTYALTHEIGHALKVERFNAGVLEKAVAAGMRVATAQQLFNDVMQGVAKFNVDPAALQQMEAVAPAEAALIKQWNELQTAFRADNRPGSGKELAQTWFGPRKFAWGVGKTVSARDIWDWLRQQERQVAKAQGRQARNIDLLTANDVAELIAGDLDYFYSFDEYMAEQFSRASYDRNYLKNTTLGRWFQDVLAKLREFFGELKDQGFVKPQETFETWLDEQTARGRAMRKGRPRNWGKVQLSKELRAIRKAQRLALRAERDALAAEGELEVAEEPHPLPEAEQIEVETSVTKEEVEELLAIMEAEMKPRDVSAVRRLIEKGNFAEAFAKLSESDETHYDRTYTSQAIRELPNKEMLQRETILGISRQQKLKKQDTEALAELLQKYPDKKIPRQAAVDAILNKNVPLTLNVSDQFAEYGLLNVDLPLNETLVAQGLEPAAFSNIWEAPFKTKAANHFGSPNYVAHTRVYITANTYAITELQSDLFQARKPTEREIQHATDTVTHFRIKVERAQTLLEKLEQIARGELNADPAAVANELFLSSMPDEDINSQIEWAKQKIQQQTQDYAHATAYLQMLQDRAAGKISKEVENLQYAVGKQTWWQRIIREEIANAAKMGKQTFEFASPEQIANIEGWPFRFKEGLTYELPSPMEVKGADATLQSKRLRITHVVFHKDRRVFATDTGNLISLGDWYFTPSDTAKLRRYQAVAEQTWKQQADAIILEDPDHQSIFDRYAKDIIPWLEKTYGAKRNDLGWYEFPVLKGAEEVLLWDKGNPANPTYPQLTNHQLAGIDEVDMTPEEMKRAMDAWATLGFDSPYFKRWWQEGKLVDGITGQPFKVYHGTGSIVRFFDKTLARWEQAFFFSATPKTAKWYADKMMIGYGRKAAVMADHEDQRKAQNLRERIQVWEKNFEEQRVQVDPVKVRAHISRMKAELAALESTAEWKTPEPTIGEYYVRINTPFEIDFEGDEWTRGAYEEYIRLAKELGHDGMIIRNVKDPLLDTVYIAFDPEQIKDAVHQTGAFGETDLVMWDKQNPVQSTLANIGRVLDAVGEVNIWQQVLNGFHRTSDALVQLQQRAARPLPDGTLDTPMQYFLNATWQAEAFKNSLMYQGEELVKVLWSRSPEELDQIYAVMEAEWKSRVLAFDLVGLDAAGEIIWGNLPDGGRDVTAATGKRVVKWDFVPTKRLEGLLTKAGISLNTPHGQELLQIIYDLKIAMLDQMTALEQVLSDKILSRYEMAPMVAAVELEKLYQVMQKIRQTPFFPQGWYGDWVISIQEQKENPAKGERKYKLVRVEHYETKAEMQQALRRWYKLRSKDDRIKISWYKREELEGIPMQLPRNLLDQIAQTGMFTEDQLEVLQETMLPVGHEKLSARYDAWARQLEGGQKDIVRNFSNFIWHNANFVWKLKFREDFTKALNAQTALWKQAQKDGTELGMKQADMLFRNKKIMERVKQDLLYPPNEFQKIRQAIAMLYLAYNVKTALMNFSTMLNTYAAITTEYGEIQGHKLFAQGLWNTARLFHMRSQQKAGELSAKDSEYIWAYDRAVREGVLDQSFAFFLAGQANATTDFKGTRKGYGAKFSHYAQTVGMFPFRTVEKANRTATFMMFFAAERARKSNLETAFREAVTRTNLLQNAYNQANRPELFRGKKALLTMFMSYVQFMTWNMYGGYAGALKANLESRGLKTAHLAGPQAYTVKLMLIYLLLGGMFAGPGFDDLMEVVSYIWRKLYRTNARVELREFIREMGWNPDLVTHGLLSNVAGMDLSGGFTLGRIAPGVQLLNRSMSSPAEFVGSAALRVAGPFGGFIEDILKATVMLDKYLRGEARGSQVLAELPGAIGGLGKAYDAMVLQRLAPTNAVLTKSGARLVEDPPGSGEFRDLTNWELIGMALNGNPSVLSRNRELHYWRVGEQIYWRTQHQRLLDARWKAINTHDDEKLARIDEEIEKFNESLSDEHQSLRITGKMKAQSLKAHRQNKLKEEMGLAKSRRMHEVVGEIQ